MSKGEKQANMNMKWQCWLLSFFTHDHVLHRIWIYLYIQSWVDVVFWYCCIYCMLFSFSAWLPPRTSCVCCWLLVLFFFLLLFLFLFFREFMFWSRVRFALEISQRETFLSKILRAPIYLALFIARDRTIYSQKKTQSTDTPIETVMQTLLKFLCSRYKAFRNKKQNFYRRTTFLIFQWILLMSNWPNSFSFFHIHHQCVFWKFQLSNLQDKFIQN